jgi:flavin reductase (DIM6/NTAB) family NADH-FMN oxidoreductase RutF
VTAGPRPQTVRPPTARAPSGSTLAPAHQVQPIEARTLRQVCGLFVTGVTVITTGGPGAAAGTTVNSFTSVSLEPPLVLFCLHEKSRLHESLAASGGFAVNFLAGGQETLARAFAGRQSVPVDEHVYRRSAAGVPVLGAAMAYLACRTAHVYPGGDHTIVVGEVVEIGAPARRREPLIFFEGAFGLLEEDQRGTQPVWDG